MIKSNNPQSDMLYDAILALRTVDECKAFFQDLCTVAELRAMEQRFDVARMLHAGKVYTTILSETGASSATVSRVNRVLNYGTGALAEVMERVEQTKEGETAPQEDNETRRNT